MRYQAVTDSLAGVRHGLVGGRKLDVTKEEVVGRMRLVEPEPIREHLVEIDGTAYPAKQVLAVMSAPLPRLVPPARC